MTRRDAMTAAAGVSLAMAQGQRWKIGLIGNGNRGTAHLGAYVNMPEANVTALSDLESSRMAAYNTKLGGKAAQYNDWRELIKDKNVDIVAIATPNYLHPEMAIAALRAGKHVLLEKPIAIDYKLARQIQAEAKKSGRVLAIGMQRRFMARDHWVQQIVDSGAIGQVRFINIGEYRGDWSPKGSLFTDPESGRRDNWRFFQAAAGSTELEFSVHAFSQVTQLAKSPLARCVASGGTVHYKDHQTRDICQGSIDFANGVRFNYTFCLFSAGTPGNTVIVGDKGTIRYTTESGILLDMAGKKGQAPPPHTGFSGEKPEVAMYREFFAAIRESREPALNAELAIEAAKIAYAMEIATVENRVVTARDFA